MRRGRRGQALAEAVLLLPVVVLLIAAPVAVVDLADRRLTGLEAARHAAWDATVPAARAQPASPVAVRVSRQPDGLVTAVVRVHAREAGHLEATALLYTVSHGAGTEASGRSAVREGWLGGLLARPARELLRTLLGEDPIRLDFDARPLGVRR
jgi:hypothetical protein